MARPRPRISAGDSGHGAEVSRGRWDGAALGVRDLSKSFGGRSLLRRLFHRQHDASGNGRIRVLDHVSFQVRRGEIYGLIGANGSGKSTLIRIISTLLLPDAGDVHVFGLDAVKEEMRVRALINRVSADPSFFRTMSALENLLFFGGIYGLTPRQVKERAPEILGRLGLEWERALEPMSHLSRGQQQKAAVARSFLTSPILMLLDEPTTGLDPRSKREVQAFIRDVQREHDATILLTTHDMEEAELLSDRIALLVGGRIAAEGTPEELRRQIAGGRPLESIDMETVFMELTGQSLEEDEAPQEVRSGS